MSFQGILFNDPDHGAREQAPAMPAFFGDLNLDQIVATVTADKDEYDLEGFFYSPLHDIDAIHYRHEVFRDLEEAELFEQITRVAAKLRRMRQHLAQAEELSNKYQKQRCVLDAVVLYCDAVTELARDLAQSNPESRGLLGFTTYLTDYVHTDAFAALAAETQQLATELSGIQYNIAIKGGRVSVRHYADEPDYSAVIVETFRKFEQGEAGQIDFKLLDMPRMNTVESRILDGVVRLHPDLFLRLDRFCAAHSGYRDDTIIAFDREVQFYIAWLGYLARLKQAGLTFCYPDISDRDKTVCNEQGFDLALAQKLVSENAPVVTNDFQLTDPERIIVVSGPNQGGKTTFARMFGQLHYLASLGCPVPGNNARLFLCDSLFTHFEKAEDIHDLRGKLEDDLLRIHDVLTHATPHSILIVNEIFSSTTSRDALLLGQKVLHRISDMDALCVCVTFIDELSSLNETTVSMVSTVEPDNPARRTYKVVRKPADGLAYARSIAEKYRLTRDALRHRL